MKEIKAAKIRFQASKSGKKGKPVLRVQIVPVKKDRKGNQDPAGQLR